MKLGSNDEDFKMEGKGYKHYTNCKKEKLDTITKDLESKGIKYIVSEKAYSESGFELSAQDKSYRAIYIKR